MVFRPPDAEDDEIRKDPISLKKLRQGDGALETCKVVLGWLIDTVAGTIELPPAKVERLRELLASFPRRRKTCPTKDLLKLVGELRSMIVALPGGVGCLSWLQERVKAAASTRVYLNRQFHDAIDDFRWLAGDVCSRTTTASSTTPPLTLQRSPWTVATVAARPLRMPS